MYTEKNRIKAAKKPEEMATRIKSNSEQIFGVKASRVYAQIAKTGRNPQKKEERVILIDALNSAIEGKHGMQVKNVPQYIPMKGKDIFRCFGGDINFSPSTVFVCLDK